MVGMFLLGLIALSFETDYAALYPVYARTLLAIYALGVASNLLDRLVHLRRKTSDRPAATWGVLRWRTRGDSYTIVVNFLLDLAFVAGVIVIDPYDEGTVALSLVSLTGIRFLAHVAGGPPNLARLAPLTALVPLVFLLVQGYYSAQGHLPGLAEELILAILLLNAYSIISNINRRIGEEAKLSAALAERDLRLKQSAISAEEDARRLAEQVLRLDLLQDCIRAINSAIELDELLLMIVNNAVRVLKAEQSSIGLVDEATGELVIQCATGVDASVLRRRRFPPGIGVAGWVAQSGKPLVVEDVRLDIRYVDTYTDESVGRTTRSMLCVPLIVERSVIGTLCVTHSQPNALTEADQHLLTSFAEQAALAVHKSQLLDERTRQGEELRRRGEIITSLHSIGQSVLSSLDLPEVLDTIISRMSEVTSFDHGLVYLINERTDTTELVASNDNGNLPEQLTLDEGTRAMEMWTRAKNTGEAQICEEGLCGLCLPLVNRRKPIGCVLLARAGGNPFTEVERDAAEKLTDAATIAIVNARLFSRVSVQQQQAAALYRLMLKVNAAPNRRQLAQVICHELQQITGARGAALLIHDTEHANLVGWACYGDWLGSDIGSISLLAQGDPFVSSVLTALHQMDVPGLLVMQNAPAEVRQLFGSTTCVTIPLAQGGRIYGLLVFEPGQTPAVPEDIKETVSLAISHSTVALERAELFEQTLTAARQSSMLYSIAAEIQTSLDPQTVVRMTINGALEALPIESCEVYIFDEEHQYLRRAGAALATGVKEEGTLHGPDIITPEADPVLVEVLRSPNMVTDDLAGMRTAHESEGGLSVLLGRLMGSDQPLGVLRITTTLASEEFIHRHATFCQTLLTHSGGALERSRLYTTTANQARILGKQTQQLMDILNLGILSAADVPLPTLMPQIAAEIARSLQFAYVRIGQMSSDGNEDEVWASSEQIWTGGAGQDSAPLTLEDLNKLMKMGTPAHSDVRGVFLDEAMLVELVPDQPKPQLGHLPRQLILMLLESTGGEPLGYILAAINSEMDSRDPTSKNDFLEVLSIFAMRIALIIENHLVYSQLLDSKRKIEAVVLSIGDGVIVTDAEMNVLITNSLADQLLGAYSSEVRGQPFGSLINNEELTRMLEECLTASKSHVTDVDLRLGRDIYTYQAVVHPITAPEEGVQGAVLTLRDVTVERATERAKSDFLSIVSHELRTPLNSVMGFLDIILMGKTGELTELQRDFLGTAKQEAVVLQRLINDVLDYSQLQSGMFRMEMAPLNLSSVISRVVNQAVPRMQQDELTLTNSVPAGLLVIGDEIRLEQVFRNLLDNAAKFTDPGGEIKFECAAGGDTVTISVRDTGTGIPPAQVADVFGRFFQAENVASRPKRGLGLGLAICKNIVEAHGGKIWLESELGTGTVVHVELLLFDAESDLYNFDVKTGKATLNVPLETVSAER